MARPKKRHCANCIGALSLRTADGCLLMSVSTIAGELWVFTNERVHYSRRAVGVY